MRGTITTLTTSVTLPASVELLWPLLSDTDRTNRMIGLPVFERTTSSADLTQTIYGHYVRVPVSWREHPFEWVFEQQFSVTRAFDAPFPVEWLTTLTRLVAIAPSSTRVDVEVRLAARSALGAIGGRLVVGQQMLRDMRAAYVKLGELAVNAATAPAARPLRSQVNSRRLQAGADRLRQIRSDASLVERLVDHLSAAEDAEVVKMRPFALADAWRAPRMDVLRLFLYATRAGLLDLEWDVICPYCRGASLRAHNLGELHTEAHCPSCQVRYDVNFDEQVELRFSVSPMVRAASDLSYCIGGPANTLHILAQIWLPPRERKELALRLPAGTYRFRSRQSGGDAVIEAAAGVDGAQLSVVFDAQHIEPSAARIESGNVRIELVNRHDTAQLVVLEQQTWSAQAASASLVTALSEFRQLFSSEVLAPGQGLAVKTLTFLFSDLKNSTAIYDSIGDSPAYARVRDHFAVMQQAIAQHNGAQVKTIGDAVMAVFANAEDALAASIAIQQDFIGGAIAMGDPALSVKLGLHRGPCIAVNANALLDYFGSTVNIAARVQNESIGGDIVITEDILDDPEVAQLLASVPHTAERFERTVKGISRPLTLTRLTLAAPHAHETPRPQPHTPAPSSPAISGPAPSRA